MHTCTTFLLAVTLLTATSARTPLDDDDLGIRVLNPAASYKDVCETIGRRLRNSSAVHYPDSTAYGTAVYHSSPAASRRSACVVEPETAEEVGAILQIIGANRTPFAVKGGGHIMNAGFSSTHGIHISTARFDDIKYNPTSQYGAEDGDVTLGAGLTWDQVYAALDPQNVSVAGGRAVGVGVAGYILGGGFSYWTNLVGMTVDTVLAFELVTTDGKVQTVTAKDEELFWALKGGGNNLGIVTRFTLKAIPYTEIWGGLLVNLDAHQEVANLARQFELTVTDPKATVVSTLFVIDGTPLASTTVFYGAPTPPPGMFDAFLNISNPVQSEVKTRKMGDLVGTTAENPTKGLNGAFHGLTLKSNTQEVVDATVKETSDNAAALKDEGIVAVAYNIEPLVRDYLTRPRRTSDSVFPPLRVRNAGAMPLVVFYAWSPKTDSSDATIRTALKASVDRLQVIASKGEDEEKPLERYPNYSLSQEEGTDLEDLYGFDGARRLGRIARKVDPAGVMKLAGGFKAQPAK